MKRVSPYIPTIMAAWVSAWFGLDHLFLRDEASAFLHYGYIDTLTATKTAGLLTLIGSLVMITGLACGREQVTRPGYVLAAAGYGIFAIGFFISSILVGDTPTGNNSISAATPGMTYGLLAVWMLLTSIHEWDPKHDPHR